MHRSIAFRFWQLVILLLRSVTLFSFAWLAAAWLQPALASQSAAHSAVTAFAFVEAAFFVYYVLARRRLLERKPLPHRCRGARERRNLMEQCVAAMRLARSAMGVGSKPEIHLGWRGLVCVGSGWGLGRVWVESG